MITTSVGRWVGGSVSKWTVVSWSVVGGFNKTLHRENEINNFSKLFVKLVSQQLFCRTPLRSVFRTQSNINDGVFDENSSR